MDYVNFYQGHSQYYNSSRLDEGLVFSSTIDFIINESSTNSLNVLDIGCGTGEYGYALRCKGFNVTGIDKSPTQIKIAQEKINAFECDALQLPFEKEQFDVVTMIMMIHQIDAVDLKKLFLNVRKVLKPEGLLIIKTCLHDDIETRITSSYFPTCKEFDLKRYHSLETILTAAQYFELKKLEKISIVTQYSTETLFTKFRNRGASNIGMLSEEELENGLSLLQKDYPTSSQIDVIFDNSFIVLKPLSL